MCKPENEPAHLP